MTVAVRQLIQNALSELNVLMVNETVGANDANYCLQKLNRLLDNINAEPAGVYAERQQTYTLTPGLQPHTWGPTGATFTITERPPTLEGASIVLTGAAPNANCPLALIDYQQWQSVIVPTVRASVPQWLYYQAEWPNASLYLWPVPTTAYQILLQFRIALSQVGINDTLNLPQGYIDMLTLTLCEDIAETYGRPVSRKLEQKAQAARARVMSNNRVTPTLVTNDSGIPTSGGSSGRRADFNWMNGQIQ